MVEVIYVLSGEIAWFTHVKLYGDRFESPFERAIELLKSSPEIGSRYSIDPFRKLRLRDTPWAVFYAVAGNRVVIHTIQDLRQDPETLHKKLLALLP